MARKGSNGEFLESQNIPTGLGDLWRVSEVPLPEEGLERHEKQLTRVGTDTKLSASQPAAVRSSREWQGTQVTTQKLRTTFPKQQQHLQPPQLSPVAKALWTTRSGPCGTPFHQGNTQTSPHSASEGKMANRGSNQEPRLGCNAS